MGLDILDLHFRLERTFGVVASRRRLASLLEENDPPDIRAGDLFEFFRSEARRRGVLDLEVDAEALWPRFQRAVSVAIGIDEHEVAKDRWILGELGAG